MTPMNGVSPKTIPNALPTVFTEQVAGIPVRFSIYHRDMRIANDSHRFLVPNNPFIWLIMADPYGDMSADTFFSSAWTIRIFEGVSWRGYTADEGECDDLLARLRQQIADDVPGYLVAAQNRAFTELFVAMRDYAAMVLDLEEQTDDLTCPECGYEDCCCEQRDADDWGIDTRKARWLADEYEADWFED